MNVKEKLILREPLKKTNPIIYHSEQKEHKDGNNTIPPD